MAGTLEISDGLSWMPAGWVYDGALERLAKAIEADRPSVARALLRARTEANGGHLDLRTFRAEDLWAIERGADEAYAQLESAGPSSFAMPEYYAGFMEQFLALREMLRLVSRARVPSGPRPSSAPSSIG
jgi:hypothetical protein